MEKKSLLVNQPIHEELKDYCEKNGVKISFVVEALIEKFLMEVKEKPHIRIYREEKE